MFSNFIVPDPFAALLVIFIATVPYRAPAIWKSGGPQDRVIIATMWAIWAMTCVFVAYMISFGLASRSAIH